MIPDRKTGKCPPLEELLDFLRGKLEAGRASALGEHLERCAKCGEAREWLEKTLAATARGRLDEPPRSVLERAFEIVPRVPVRSRPERRGWSLGRLLRDSLAQPAPAGVRSAGAAGRRLLYRAGDADLDLEVAEAAEGGPAFRVTGQLLVPGSTSPPAVFAALWSEGELLAHAAADPVGMFVFPHVQPGSYRLEVWAPTEGRGVRIQPLELTEDRR